MNQQKFKEGVALFNSGRFFEAHEAWEEIWLKDRNSETGKMLMGLIQWSAALLKDQKNQPKAALSLAQSAFTKLKSVDQKIAAAWGLNLEEWLEKIKDFLANR